MISCIKKMNVEGFSNAWKGNLSCEECSIRLNVFRRKKICFFCKNFFCKVCIIRREDEKLSCRKCQILTARPLDRNDLLNLRSRDLVNYLTSRHISTNGCVEKEDLVNVLMRAVNNTCFHPSSSSHYETAPHSTSYPNSPRYNSYSSSQSQPSTKSGLSFSAESLYDKDGIRITGHNLEDSEAQEEVSHQPQSQLQHQQCEISQSESDCESLSFSEIPTNKTRQSDPLNGENSQTNNNSTSGDDKNDSNESKTECTHLNTDKPLMLSDIKSSDDLNALTVRQLKELLLRNRTDFKGCIEREELIQKANRLWSDYTISRKDLETLALDELCKICMDAPIECVLLECGHMATCTSCGKQLCECPICRQLVVRCVRTFKA